MFIASEPVPKTDLPGVKGVGIPIGTRQISHPQRCRCRNRWRLGGGIAHPQRSRLLGRHHSIVDSQLTCVIPIPYVNASRIILILTHGGRRDDDAVCGKLPQERKRSSSALRGATPGVIVGSENVAPPGTGGDLRAARSLRRHLQSVQLPPVCDEMPKRLLRFE